MSLVSEVYNNSLVNEVFSEEPDYIDQPSDSRGTWAEVGRNVLDVNLPARMFLGWAASNISKAAWELAGEPEFAKEAYDIAGRIGQPVSKAGEELLKPFEPGFQDVSRMADQLTGSVDKMAGVSTDPSQPLFSGKIVDRSPWVKTLAKFGAEGLMFKKAGEGFKAVKSEVGSGIKSAKDYARISEKDLKPSVPEEMRPSLVEEVYKGSQKEKGVSLVDEVYKESAGDTGTSESAKSQGVVNEPALQKAPHEMTQREFSEANNDPSYTLPQLLSEHELLIKWSVEQGKYVPRNVLLEYKDQPWAKEALKTKMRGQFGDQFGEELELAKQGLIKTPDGVPAVSLSVGDRFIINGEPMRVEAVLEGDVYVTNKKGTKLTKFSEGDIINSEAAKVKNGFQVVKGEKSLGEEVSTKMEKPKKVVESPEQGKRVTYGVTDLLVDINDAFGERGAVGGKDLTPKQIQARERISKALGEFSKEAQAMGKSLPDYLASKGIGENERNKLISFMAEREAPERLTSIKNAQVTEERAARNLPEVENNLRRGQEAIYDKAIGMIESGERDPRLLAKEINEKPRAISGEEVVMLDYDRVQLFNEHQKVSENINKSRSLGDVIKEGEQKARLLEIEELMDINDRAARFSGTITAQGLAARRWMMAQDFSLQKMIQREKIDNGGKPISDEVRSKLEDVANRYKEAEEKIALLEEKNAKLEVDKVLIRIKNEAAKEKRQSGRTYKKEELAAEFFDLKKKLSKALGQETLHVGVDPAVAKILGEMAKNKVKSGIISAEAIIDEIYFAIKELGVEMSKRSIRDAISGYGIVTEMSKEALNVEMRRLRREWRSVSGYEDALMGKSPEHSGLKRDPKSDIDREWTRKIRQAMRESGIDFTSTRTPEQQWKTSLDAIKTRLNNQIRDITKQIETGEKTPKKKGVEYDAEALSLKERRDALKTILEGIEGKPEMSVQQKIKNAISSAERSIAEYERRIAEKDLTPQKKVSTTPVTPELEALRKTRDALKVEYKEMQKEARPNKTPEEVALQTYKTRTLTQMAKMEERIATGDFAPRERKPLKLDKEGLELQAQKIKAVQDYNKVRLEEMLKREGNVKKMGRGVVEAINFTRAMKTSFDVSAVFRQGMFIAVANPVRGAKAVPAMFRALASEMGEAGVMAEIQSRPNYVNGLYQQGKLFLAEKGTKLVDMEEAYMSRWAEKVPGVAASQRAYTTYLNRLRADSFDAMYKNLSKNEYKPTLGETTAIGRFINVATGRGNLGAKENALVGLNTVFFAPRLVASRFQLILGEPMLRGSMKTRVAVAKEYAKFLTGVGVIYTLASAAGADVEIDPRSSDYGKIKIGNTRIDPLAGLSQATVVLSRVGSGKTKRMSGELVPIRGDDIPYGSGNTADVIGRFLRTKLSPVVGTGVDIVAGKDVVNKKVTLADVPEKLLAPLAMNDVYEAMKENGIPAGAALGMLSIWGMGLQTFKKGEEDTTLIQDIRHEVFNEDFSSRSGRGTRRR
jgi:hypothetical protein